jgi:hypothetical protein
MPRLRVPFEIVWLVSAVWLIPLLVLLGEPRYWQALLAALEKPF